MIVEPAGLAGIALELRRDIARMFYVRGILLSPCPARTFSRCCISVASWRKADGEHRRGIGHSDQGVRFRSALCGIGKSRIVSA